MRGRSNEHVFPTPDVITPYNGLPILLRKDEVVRSNNEQREKKKGRRK